MKKNWKINNFWLLFCLLLLFLISFPTYFNNHINNENIHRSKANLKTAGYWYFTGVGIVIDETDPTKNWSYTASTYDWCTGNGTWSNPYIIENVTIDGEVSVSCLTILNSKTVFFVIRNCTIYNSLDTTGNAGLKLQNTNNGILTNNTCISNRAGIYLYSNSDNNTVVENTLIDNSLGGVYLSNGCGSNKISNNTLIDNGQYGILVSFSSNSNNITDNIIQNNGWAFNLEQNSGIELQESGDNIITDNKITNNNHNGIYLYESLTNDNIIMNNNISENKKGIRMAYNVYSNDVIDNVIKANTQYGVYISTPHPQSNNFYNNWFIDNGIQAYDIGLNNNWDNGTIGNFWSNYSGVDADDDGIGDTPYDISGTAGSQDNYPIWHDAPNIKILLPTPLEIFESSAPSFNVSIKDPNLDSMWYIINNGVQKNIFSTNESINQGVWDILSDGPIEITFYANDTAGNVNSSSVTIIRDTGAPLIHINNPSMYDVFASAPAFDVEFTDYLLNTTWYTFDSGVKKYNFTSNTSIDSDAWNGALDGLKNITFYANDTVGHINSSSVLVYKDTAFPDIWVIAPTTGSEFNTTVPDFIVDFDEANLVRMWYTINGSVTEYTFTVNGTINQAAWDALPEGELTLKFYIEDIAGHIDSDEVYIIKKLPTTDGNGDGNGTGPPIPGYPLIALISLIWITSTIILLRFKKNQKKK